MFCWVRPRKAFSAVALAALFLVGAGVLGVVSYAQGPYFQGGTVRPPIDAKTIVISVASPIDGGVYRISNVTFAFNASSQGTSLNCVTRVNYTADWLSERVIVYQQDSDDPDFPTVITHEINYQIPDGNHSLLIEAIGPGSYVNAAKWTIYHFDMTTTLAVNFTVDTTSPSISVLSPQNKTYDTANVTLNLTVSEAASQVSYVLDGEENHLPTEGDSTLTGLSNGEHNVTVCATDLAGNAGASETVYFAVKVPEPFPTVSVLVASIITIVVVVVGLLIYFKKRRRLESA